MEKLQEKNWSVGHAEKEVWEETEEMLRLKPARHRPTEACHAFQKSKYEVKHVHCEKQDIIHGRECTRC